MNLEKIKIEIDRLETDVLLLEQGGYLKEAERLRSKLNNLRRHMELLAATGERS